MASVNPLNLFGNSAFIEAIIAALEINEIFILSLYTENEYNYIEQQLLDNEYVATLVYPLLYTNIINDTADSGLIYRIAENICNYFVPPTKVLLSVSNTFFTTILTFLIQYLPSIEAKITQPQIISEASTFVRYMTATNTDVDWFSNTIDFTYLITYQPFIDSLTTFFNSRDLNIDIPEFALYNGMTQCLLDFVLQLNTISNLQFPSFVITSSVANSLSRITFKCVNKYNMEDFAVLYNETFSPPVSSCTLAFSTFLINYQGDLVYNLNTTFYNYKNMNLMICVYCETLNNSYISMKLDFVLDNCYLDKPFGLYSLP
jgi:hypothetical protein